MPLFTSSRERQFWLWALVVTGTIYATLFMGQPFAASLRDQNFQAVLFVLGMLLIGLATLFHGLKPRTTKFEISVILGIIAVYVMLFLRLGAPERSHLIEYSVLAIFVHKALIERFSEGMLWKAALFAFLITALIGTLDECLQILLPNRVFDPVDIFFNTMAAALAIGSAMILNWAKRKFQKQQSNKE